jgi:hypothetical protein
MALIRADELGQDYEDHPVADGQYELRIAKADFKRNKKDTGNLIALMLTIEGAEGEGASPINHYLSEPNDEDKPAGRRFKMRELKRFAKAFGIDISNGFDFENDAQALVGQTGKVRLVQEEGQDADGNKTGEMRNVMRLPKID